MTPQAIVAAVLLLTAALLTMQVRTERTIQQTLGVASPRLQELAYQLRRTETARQALEREVAALRERVAVMARAAGQEQESSQALSEELDRLRAQAGFAPVEGPGIVVEVRDSTRAVSIGEDPNDVLIHYSDLQAVVNDLWASGAEAVAVNGERLTVTSAIQCVGTTVLVNRRRVASPFLIAAIGNPDALEGYTNRRGSAMGLLQSYGFPVELLRRQRLTLPAYRGTIPTASLEPVP